MMLVKSSSPPHYRIVKAHQRNLKNKRAKTNMTSYIMCLCYSFTKHYFKEHFVYSQSTLLFRSCKQTTHCSITESQEVQIPDSYKAVLNVRM